MTHILTGSDAVRLAEIALTKMRQGPYPIQLNKRQCVILADLLKEDGNRVPVELRGPYPIQLGQDICMVIVRTLQASGIVRKDS